MANNNNNRNRNNNHNDDDEEQVQSQRQERQQQSPNEAERKQAEQDRSQSDESQTEQSEQQQEEQRGREVAVIVGASSGIGRATALEFAKQGYDIVLASRRGDELEDVAKHAREFEVEALVVPTDITDEQAVRSLAEAAIREFKHIDVWVNDAGVYLTGKFEDIPTEDMHRLFETNFFGYVYGSHAALTEFRRTGHGTLINISSINARAPMPYTSVYGASKAAIRAFDQSLRMELQIDGLEEAIHVSTVMPATVDTNIYQNAANYTGQEIEAIDPIYEPAYVAKQIVTLAKKPRRELIIGPAGKLLAMQRAHMPGSYEKYVSKYVKQQLLSNRTADQSQGSLFQPLKQHAGTQGGWRNRKMRADQLNASIGVGVGVLAVLTATGIALTMARRHKHKRPPTVLERSHGLLHALFS